MNWFKENILLLLKYSVECHRIILNVSHVVHSIRPLYNFLGS